MGLDSESERARERERERERALTLTLPPPYCSGNVSECAAECDAVTAFAAFMFSCHSPSKCATVRVRVRV